MADGNAIPGLGDDAGDGGEGAGFTWQLLCAMPSARLVVLRAGDVFLMQPGTYHRVFTLRSKLQLFGEYLSGPSIVASIRSAFADKLRPACLNACDSTITMSDIFAAGLKKELSHRTAAPEASAQALHVLETCKPKDAPQALRWLHPDTLTQLSTLLGFDLDQACQLLAQHAL